MSVAGEFPPNVLAAMQERHEGLMTFFFFWVMGKMGTRSPDSRITVVEFY